MADESFICKVEGVTKTFSGVVALQDVSFTVRRGEILGIVGENGAGKSTLMNILSGVFHPDRGSVELDGVPVRFRDPREAQRHGVAMIHQELSLSRAMTVADNIFQGRMLASRLGFIQARRMVGESRRHLAALGVEDIDPRTLVKHLSVSQMQLVEIAKAVSLDARLLIMDEPTSSLTTGEIRKLLEIMRGLRAKGVSILFITHKLEEVLEVADRITVLRDGRYVTTVAAGEVTSEKLVSFMVGREFERRPHRQFITDFAEREVVLEVQDLCVGDRVRGASFVLHRGEVLGLTGLVGAGRTELLQAVLGFQRATSGTVKVDGKPVRIRHPSDALALGMGMVPENRKEEGMFLRLSVLDNLTMAHLRRLAGPLGFVSSRHATGAAGRYVSELSIKTPSLAQIAQNLSGGNQQKTIIGRWLMRGPRILFLDEPTHGIDVGAKAEIYRIIDDISRQGVSIVLLSSELPEVLNLCDRIMVMHRGEIRGVLAHHEADQVAIMRLTLDKHRRTDSPPT
ncbi:MAG TPA: sugar ABC transporter ATP-binding protein [Anaeromyxobacter sp.]|nr:sugar ABC transporter ATP-binding protein [Anaeromyxobacter sp.]HVP61133.1 sugar ABC transporter ATP-binding protein [Myxococcaceae bacterium]